MEAGKVTNPVFTYRSYKMAIDEKHKERWNHYAYLGLLNIKIC